MDGERKLKCYECGKRSPESDTALVQAWVGGNYRRGNRCTKVRVCRSCTQSRVDYARTGQAEGRNCPINGTIKWAQSAKQLGIVISGLRLDQMTDRVAP